MSNTTSASGQALVGAGVGIVGAVMAWGATFISSEAGYAGVGPNALPWLVSVVLMVCGVSRRGSVNLPRPDSSTL